jgi:hypothetical protein
MKTYADKYRGRLPKFLEGKIPGTLWGTEAEIKRKRTWQSNTKPIIDTPSGRVSLINAFDDLLSVPNGIAPLDWKTRGSAPDAGYAARYNTVQSDIYHVHLQASGMTPAGETYFVFLYPEELLDYDGETIPAPTVPSPKDMSFGADVQVLESSYERGFELICRGTEILSGGQPDPHPGCELCRWAQKRVEAALACVA